MAKEKHEDLDERKQRDEQKPADRGHYDVGEFQKKAQEYAAREERETAVDAWGLKNRQQPDSEQEPPPPQGWGTNPAIPPADPIVDPDRVVAPGPANYAFATAFNIEPKGAPSPEPPPEVDAAGFPRLPLVAPGESKDPQERMREEAESRQRAMEQHAEEMRKLTEEAEAKRQQGVLPMSKEAEVHPRAEQPAADLHAADPDELEDEIDEAEDEGDIDHRGGSRSSHKRGKTKR